MTAEIKELTVGRYEWFKEKGRSDASIAKQYDMDHNQLNKWKKEHDLIGKDYGLRGKRTTDIKTVSIEDEPKLLKENDIPENSLSKSAAETEKAIQEYKANKAIKEKLKAKESEPTVITVHEEDFTLPDSTVFETIGEIPSEPTETLTEDTEHVFKMPEVNDVIEPDYQKEIAWLEERHVKDEDTIQRLKDELNAAKNHELIAKVNAAVKDERYRQNKLYGHQRHSHGDWLMILAEEFGEVSQAMQKAKGWGKDSDADNLFEELIHVAAVASAIAEQVLEERG